MEQRWVIHLFGRVRATRNGDKLEFDGLSERLIGYLAWYGYREVTELLKYVYPDQETFHDDQAFAQVRWRLNRKFASNEEVKSAAQKQEREVKSEKELRKKRNKKDQLIEKSLNWIKLNNAVALTDVSLFRQALGEVEGLSGDERLKKLQEAERWYERRPFLEGNDEEWVQLAREQLRQEYGELLYKLSECFLIQKSMLQAFQYAARWVENGYADKGSIFRISDQFQEVGLPEEAVNLLSAFQSSIPQTVGSLFEEVEFRKQQIRTALNSNRGSVNSTGMTEALFGQLQQCLDDQRYTLAACEIADIWYSYSHPNGSIIHAPDQWPSTGAIGEKPVHFSNGTCLPESKSGRRGYALNTGLVAISPLLRVQPNSRYLEVSGWASAVAVGKGGEWADRRVRASFADDEQIGELQYLDYCSESLGSIPICFPATCLPTALRLADAKGVFNGRPTVGQIHQSGMAGAGSLEGEGICEDITEARCEDRWLWLSYVPLPKGTHQVRFIARTCSPEGCPAFRLVVIVIGHVKEWADLPRQNEDIPSLLPASTVSSPDASTIRDMLHQAYQTTDLEQQWQRVDKAVDLIWEARNDFTALPTKEFDSIVQEVISVSVQRFADLCPNEGDIGGFWRRIADLARHNSANRCPEIAGWYEMAASLGLSDPQFSRFEQGWIAECYDRAALLYLGEAEEPHLTPNSPLEKAAKCWHNCANVYEHAFLSVRSELPRSLAAVFTCEAQFLKSGKRDAQYRQQVYGLIRNMIGRGAISG